MNEQLFNVIHLGFGFLLVFLSFQTMANIQKIILSSIHDNNPDYSGDGYISQCIIYLVFGICNLGTPSLQSITGPRFAIVIGGICYVLFISSFFVEYALALYIASAIVGVGAAIIWVGQGTYLTSNSEASTMSRNAGIFWAMFQCSILLGNIYVYFAFANETHISADTRRNVFIVLTSVSVVGIILLCLLRKPPVSEHQAVAGPPHETSLVREFLRTMKTLSESSMMILCITFIYMGLIQTFANGVYGSCIGFTTSIADFPKQYVGISGFLLGLGEVAGGTLFAFFGKELMSWGRSPVIGAGFGLNVLAFVLIFINLPDDSPFKDTNAESFIKPNVYLAIGCSFILGLADSCFNNQVYSIIGLLWKENSAPAFAIFKFMQSIAASLSFFYSNLIGLYIQLGILSCFLIIGSVAFIYVDLKCCSTLSNKDTPDAPRRNSYEERNKLATD